MNPAHIDRLQEEEEQSVNEADDKILKWEKFLEDYEALQTQLCSLPDHTTYDIMVPFGSLAFMPGKLVHTNEVLVLLGDNWFAERSAKQAHEIITRRCKSIKMQIKELKEEKKLLKSRMGFVSELKDISVSHDIVDICESYDQEKEEKWKVEHRKNMQEYRRQLQEKKMQITTECSDKKQLSESELWVRLEELERLEAERHELDRETESSEDEQPRCNIITFTHTKVHQEQAEGENVPPEESLTMRSPSDIYRLMQPSGIKSILKQTRRTSSEETSEQLVSTSTKAFSGRVVEKATISNKATSEQAAVETPRRTSRFKSDRQKQLTGKV